MSVVLPHDVVAADLPPGIIIDAPTGRMFRVTLVTRPERKEINRSMPDLHDRETVVSAVRGREARERCTALRADYDAAAAVVARVWEGDHFHRYAVRVSSADTPLIPLADGEA